MEAPTLRALGVGEILDVSLKLAFRRFGTLARIVLLVVAPAQALVAVIDLSAIPNYRPGNGFFYPQSQTQPVTATQAWTTIAGSLVAFLVSYLAGQFATGACFRTIAESYLGLSTDWRSAMSFAARRFHSILWISVLGTVVAGLGFVFCLVPGIYLLVSFAVALPVLMAEGQRGRKALGRSRSLVEGRWWKTALTLLVASLLVLIVSGVITGLVVALVLTGVNNVVALALITAVSGTAAALVTTPFVAAYHTVIYFDLRVRKEAFDLRLLADRIGVEPPAGWVPPPEPLVGAGHPPYWPPPPGWQPPSGWSPPPYGTVPLSGMAGRAASGPGARGSEPPFWPPPPGWKPAAAPGLPPPGAEPGPPPPPGSQPGRDPDPPLPGIEPPFWPPPPGWRSKE